MGHGVLSRSSDILLVMCESENSNFYSLLFVTLFEKEVYHKVALAEICSNPPSSCKMVNVVARLFNFRFTCRISEVHDVPRGPPVEGPSFLYVCR